MLYDWLDWLTDWLIIRLTLLPGNSRHVHNLRIRNVAAASPRRPFATSLWCVSKWRRHHRGVDSRRPIDVFRCKSIARRRVRGRGGRGDNIDGAGRGDSTGAPRPRLFIITNGYSVCWWSKSGLAAWAYGVIDHHWCYYIVAKRNDCPITSLNL